MAKKGTTKKKGKLWGGRFEGGTDPDVEAFGASVHFDGRLAPYDLAVSRAHARMLAKVGLISQADARTILQGLSALQKQADAGRLALDPALEDVHTNIEAALTKKVGPVGGKLHTGRSRNDLVSTSTRLFLRDRIDETVKLLEALVGTLAGLAKKETGTLLPGYTHLQRAQPVTLAHHLLAYAQMFLRDRERLLELRKRANVLPLGSGALAGSSLPLDRTFVAKELGFEKVSANSLDAVSDRDYQIEFLGAAALSGMHLSRMAEELVLWNSSEFGFVKMSDAFTTGSSLMPQKRNPDVAELARGKSGRLYGALVSVLTMMKGLPLSYNRDMQEDKEALFDAADTWSDCLLLMEKLLRACSFQREKMAAAASDPNLLATELADYLVRKGLPFREAHEVVGRLVSETERQRCTLVDFEVSDFKNACDLFGGDVLRILDPWKAVEARTLPGGPAARAVGRQLSEIERILKQPARQRRPAARKKGPGKKRRKKRRA